VESVTTSCAEARGDELIGSDGFDAADYSDSAAFVNASLSTGYTGGGAGRNAPAIHLTPSRTLLALRIVTP
jgi:hypothetical protein